MEELPQTDWVLIRRLLPPAATKMFVINLAPLKDPDDRLK